LDIKLSDTNTEVFTFQKRMGKVSHYRIPPGYTSIKYFPTLKSDLDFSMLKVPLVWNVLYWIFLSQMTEKILYLFFQKQVAF